MVNPSGISPLTSQRGKRDRSVPDHIGHIAKERRGAPGLRIWSRGVRRAVSVRGSMQRAEHGIEAVHCSHAWTDPEDISRTHSGPY